VSDRHGRTVSDENLLDALTATVSNAAATILAVGRAARAPRANADRAPVTQADVAAETAILEGLARAVPGVPVVSEEAIAGGEVPDLGTQFFLVDPIDGTRELIDGRPEYAVNVALVVDGVPIIGVIAAPALGLVWRGMVGHGAERLKLAPGAQPKQASERVAIRTRPFAGSGAVAAVSRSHRDAVTDAFLARLPIEKQIVCGSAIKFCRVAEGAADVYPRLAPTSDWDVAAGAVVLAAAGGMVMTPQGAALGLAGPKQGFRIPGFVAWGDKRAAATFMG
jgi:3'(2'), 5'-bisphosphate nucleotidase